MPHTRETLLAHIRARLAEVRQSLGVATEAVENPEACFGEWLDSMGMVEFLACLAEDCGVPSEAIEECVGRRFGTVAELAVALHAAGIGPREGREAMAEPRGQAAVPHGQPSVPCWLSATACRLPRTIQDAISLDAAVHRPAGWLERHSGIRTRRVWDEEDPLLAAADAGRDCLGRAGLAAGDVGALLVTSEAPPLLVGLGAALHHRLELRPSAAALEVGGACCGFLAALWLAQSLLVRSGPILVIALEAPSRYLEAQLGAAGEAAALFGDGAAACLIGAEPAGPEAVQLHEVSLGADGAAGGLIQVRCVPPGRIELGMEGSALASRAVRAMAEAVRDLAGKHGLHIGDLDAVVAHGGNGRLPALLARQLGLSEDRVWSETASTGNLGSASLPVAWAAHESRPRGPVAWTAVGAGLTWGAALTRSP